MNKFKNPYFWLGLGSVVFASANIEFTTLTSWQLLFEALNDIVRNPAVLVAILTNMICVWNDNSTPGLDKIKK